MNKASDGCSTRLDVVRASLGSWQGGMLQGGRRHPSKAGRLAPNSVPSPWQGLDRTGRPLIIGPEEDYDPGYFNNEVTVSKVFLAFVPFSLGDRAVPLPHGSLCGPPCPGI